MNALARLAALRATGTLCDAALALIDRGCDAEDDARSDRECARPMGRFERQAMQRRMIVRAAEVQP